MVYIIGVGCDRTVGVGDLDEVPFCVMLQSSDSVGRVGYGLEEPGGTIGKGSRKERRINDLREPPLTVVNELGGVPVSVRLRGL